MAQGLLHEAVIRHVGIPASHYVGISTLIFHVGILALSCYVLIPSLNCHVGILALNRDAGMSNKSVRLS